MTLKGSTAQACAACKYQRRRCLPECKLAPYFPSDKPKMFQNVHRLFGVSNILKILKIVDPSQHNETVRSIIYESEMRHKHPALGCYGVVQYLNFHVRVLEERLHAIRLQIEFYKQQNKQQNISNSLVLQNMENQNNMDSAALLQLRIATSNNADNINDRNGEQIWGIPQPELGMAATANNGDNSNDQTGVQMWELQGPVGSYGNNLMDQFEMNTDYNQQQQYLFDLHSQQQQREDMMQHFEVMKPFMDCGGQSSFIDSKIAYELSSSGSDDQSPSLRSLMDAAEHQVAEK